MVRRKKFIPERGDIVWIDLDPTLGHEQKGRRPALILSTRPYNKASGLMLACPITRVSKNYPYEVAIGDKGVVLTDQVRSLSWKNRNIEFIISIPEDILIKVFHKIKTLLDI